MRKTRTLALAGIAAAAMTFAATAGATAAGAAPLDTGVGPDAAVSVSALGSTPRLPVCKPPDCRYV